MDETVGCRCSNVILSGGKYEYNQHFKTKKYTAWKEIQEREGLETVMEAVVREGIAKKNSAKLLQLLLD